MVEKKQPGDLEIEQDLRYQENEWRVERIGGVGMALLVLAALAGLFGAGPGASARQESGPLRVRYRRVVRFYAPTDLIVNYTPAQPQGETVRFWIDRDAFDYFRVEQIVPQPESAQLLPDRILYEFQAPETGQPLRVA